jgi:hypothetical protein
MKFIEGRRYFAVDGKNDFTVEKRFGNKNLVRGFVGFGLPANYKIRADYRGCEYITAKGHVFEARY